MYGYGGPRCSVRVDVGVKVKVGRGMVGLG